MSLQDELDGLRRALDEVNSALRPLRARPALTRQVRRLESDLGRMQEDVNDLSVEAAGSGSGSVPPARDFDPIPVPPREDIVTYDPEAEDEGLAGWRSPAVSSQPRVERRR